MTALLGDDRFGAVCTAPERFRLTTCAFQPLADLWFAPPAGCDAWVCRSAPALIVRVAIDGGGPFLVHLAACAGEAGRTPAIGGLDLTGPGTVVALRIVTDGLMTYAGDALRLDMATTATLIAGAGPDRRALDDRLCDLAVDLVRPGGYHALRAGRRRSRSGWGPAAPLSPGSATSRPR